MSVNNKWNNKLWLVLGVITFLGVLGQPWQSFLPKWPSSQLKSKLSTRNPCAESQMSGWRFLAQHHIFIYLFFFERLSISLPVKTKTWLHSCQYTCPFKGVEEKLVPASGCRYAQRRLLHFTNLILSRSTEVTVLESCTHLHLHFPDQKAPV